MITFYDTNMIVYLFDQREPLKRALIQDRFSLDTSEYTVVTSTQVMQEFYKIATGKLQHYLSRVELMAALAAMSKLQVITPTANSVIQAAHLHEEHQLSWWDALIVESALRAGADQLLSEDLQHGRKFGRMKVVNPFVQSNNSSKPKPA